jgi:HlyD family secretion protein
LPVHVHDFYHVVSKGTDILKKLAIVLPVIAIAGAAIWWQTRPEPLQVWTAKAEFGPVEQTVSNTRAGTIKACRRSKLSMRMGGVVDKLEVRKGDHVEAGQLLLELWSQDQTAGLGQVRAALDAARQSEQQACVLADRSQREYERLKTLAARKLVAVDMVDNAQSNARAQKNGCNAAKAQVESAQAQVTMQESVLERFQLRAPFAGVVAEINGEIGEYITPSPPGVATPPAVDLIDTSCLYATAPIDEVDAAALKLGMPVTITLDAFRGREFRGQLTRIAPYVVDLEKQARTVDVDVKFDKVPEDVALLIGYSADVTIILDSRQHVLRVPSESLISNKHIWVLDTATGLLHKREVKTGIGNFTNTEIVGGLSEGDVIVRSPDQPGIAEGVSATVRSE